MQEKKAAATDKAASASGIKPERMENCLELIAKARANFAKSGPKMTERQAVQYACKLVRQARREMREPALKAERQKSK